MIEQLRKKVNYSVVCVNEFARKKNIQSKEAFLYLYQHEGIKFLDENYDIEHTLSLEDAVMDKKMQLIEYGTQDIIAFFIEDEKMNMIDAMHLFYTSETFEKLQDEETGLYLESSAYVYDLFKNEYQNGRIIQEEI